jgi:hypothetical protein
LAFSKKRSENRKRGRIIGFRASDEECKQIETAADRVGLTPSSYVRSRAIAAPTTRAMRRPPVATAQLARLLAMLGAAGGALQRLESGSPQADAAIADFRLAAAAIMQTLGKRT